MGDYLKLLFTNLIFHPPLKYLRRISWGFSLQFWKANLFLHHRSSSTALVRTLPHALDFHGKKIASLLHTLECGSDPAIVILSYNKPECGQELRENQDSCYSLNHA